MRTTHEFSVRIPTVDVLTNNYAVPGWLRNRFDILLVNAGPLCIQAVGALGRHLPQPKCKRLHFRDTHARDEARQALASWEDAMTKIEDWLSFLHGTPLDGIETYATQLTDASIRLFENKRQQEEKRRFADPPEARIAPDWCQQGESLADFAWVLRAIQGEHVFCLEERLKSLDNAVAALTGKGDHAKHKVTLLPDPSAFGPEHRAAILAEDPHAWWASPYYPPVG